MRTQFKNFIEQQYRLKNHLLLVTRKRSKEDMILIKFEIDMFKKMIRDIKTSRFNEANIFGVEEIQCLIDSRITALKAMVNQ
jgi:hypothetical protein